jgi:hypothetical protein
MYRVGWPATLQCSIESQLLVLSAMGAWNVLIRLSFIGLLRASLLLVALSNRMGCR